MARKYDFISELYNRTCKTVVASPASWEAFLRSACYNYRLRFDEQLLVHAQRPDATAVLQIDDWNQKFGRWVNRGAHGIAVFEDADQRRQRLVHYFDIADTHPSRFSRRVPIWQMRDEYTAEVIDTLESTFGELNDKETLAVAIESAAKNAVEDNIPDYLSNLIYSVKDSFLDGVSEEEITAPEKPMGEPIDDEGNAYTRDLLYDKATNKQFITIQTKNGNTFYIVIDYDAPINEYEEQYQTYFLNMVDESDLLALLDDDTAAALTTCNCKEKCAAGQVNTDCPVCKTNMSECTGTAPVTPEPDKDAEADTPAPKPEKKSNVGMILVIFALAGAAGAAYYYIKFVKGRKPKDEDMDFFDDEGYEEEPYINEDEEPQIAEDAETDGDED